MRSLHLAPTTFARGSILGWLPRCALAMASTGCLVTSEPQFQPPQHTAPFLVASLAMPDPRSVVVVDQHMVEQPHADPADDAHWTFSAPILSQDDPSGSTGTFQSVAIELYLDYGVEVEPGQPFRWLIDDTPDLDAGTLEEGADRIASETWYPNSKPLVLGCHTATLIVSHHFDSQHHCPVCANDSSSITWHVLMCDSSIPDNCEGLPVTGSPACVDDLGQGMPISCTTVLAGDAETMCPEMAAP